MNLDAMGIPGVFVASSEFERGAIHQAQALGAVTPAIYVAHPIQDRTDEEMVALAEDAADEIVSKLLD
jgi:hypothetical protein